MNMSISKLQLIFLHSLQYTEKENVHFFLTFSKAEADQKSQDKIQLSLLENRAFSGRIPLVNPSCQAVTGSPRRGKSQSKGAVRRVCVAKCKATEGGYQPFNRSNLIGKLPVDANEAIFILIAILFPAIVMVTWTKGEGE